LDLLGWVVIYIKGAPIFLPEFESEPSKKKNKEKGRKQIGGEKEKAEQQQTSKHKSNH
jgi:hypothetical protein